MKTAATLIRVALLGVALAAWLPPDSAHGKPQGRGHEARHKDGRHGHDRHYLKHGHRVRVLPRNHLTISFGGHHHYYHLGIWYRHHDHGYVVGPAPVGAGLRRLPPHHTTVWVRGVPYYYANLTYYLWHPAHGGYIVVDPPSEADVITQAGELFVYPSRGQSEEQQAEDRYECHRWAVSQTGFDPSLPVSAEQEARLAQMRSDYDRALGACLEGRGYTVK